MPPSGRTTNAAANVPKVASSRGRAARREEHLAERDGDVAVDAEVEPFHRIADGHCADGALEQALVDDGDVVRGERGLAGRRGREAAIGLTCVAVKVMHSFDCAGTDGRPTRFAGKREVVCSASGQAFEHLLREWR
jgi:hypothetical protein